MGARRLMSPITAFPAGLDLLSLSNLLPARRVRMKYSARVPVHDGPPARRGRATPEPAAQIHEGHLRGPALLKFLLIYISLAAEAQRDMRKNIRTSSPPRAEAELDPTSGHARSASAPSVPSVSGARTSKAQTHVNLHARPGRLGPARPRPQTPRSEPAAPLEACSLH